MSNHSVYIDGQMIIRAVHCLGSSFNYGALRKLLCDKIPELNNEDTHWKVWLNNNHASKFRSFVNALKYQGFEIELIDFYVRPTEAGFSPNSDELEIQNRFLKTIRFDSEISYELGFNVEDIQIVISDSFKIVKVLTEANHDRNKETEDGLKNRFACFESLLDKRTKDYLNNFRIRSHIEFINLNDHGEILIDNYNENKRRERINS